MTDWLKYKFHPSSLGKVMTPGKAKDDVLGETCKAHLLECWIKETYGRVKDIQNKYIEKGRAVEEDSITLYSRACKKFMKKNTAVIENDYLIGTPDLIDGETIVDIKSCWDIHTFFSVFHKPVNKDYAWQLSAYVELMKKKYGRLVYCLVDTPEVLINDAKRQLQYRMGVIDPVAHPLYQEACERIEKEMTFGDIPINRRYIEFDIDLAKYKIETAYEKIDLCREFLQSLDKAYNP